MTNIWGIDFHDQKWPTVQKNFSALAGNGCKFAIIKGPMGLGDTNHVILDAFFKLCQQYKVAGAVYGWEDPIYDLDAQLKRFQTIIDVYNPAFVGMDFEQWWKDWTAYNNWVGYHTIAQTAVPRFSSADISSKGKYYIENLAKMGKPTLLYSNLGFIGTFSPASLEWASTYPAWDAGYLSNAKRIFTSWGEYNSAFAGLTVFKPSLTGSTLWMKQFMSAWVLPLMGDNYDLNCVDEVTFQKLTGTQPMVVDASTTKVTILPTPEPVVLTPIGTYQIVNCNGLNVRPSSQPDLTKDPLSTLPATVTSPNTITGYAEQNGWMKISKDQEQWVSAAYLKKLSEDV